MNNLENYSTYIINSLELSDRQIFVWILELNGNVYQVVINTNGLLDLKQPTNWNPLEMNHWIRLTLPKFYFNSQKNRYYDFMEQKNVSHKLIADLSNFDLLIDQILILKSIDMSSYPDNLLINN